MTHVVLLSPLPLLLCMQAPSMYRSACGDSMHRESSPLYYTAATCVGSTCLSLCQEIFETQWQHASWAVWHAQELTVALQSGEIRFMVSQVVLVRCLLAVQHVLLTMLYFAERLLVP